MEDIEKLHSRIKRLESKVESQKRTIKSLRYLLDMFKRQMEGAEKTTAFYQKAYTNSIRKNLLEEIEQSKRCPIVELSPNK